MNDSPLHARTLNEVRYYMMVQPCASCSKGPWVAAETGQPDKHHRLTFKAKCKNCSGEQTFEFLVDRPLGSQGAKSEAINPTGSPSEIIDVAQWLSLFYMLVESAASRETPAVSRRASYQAALCLAEALKFYGDNELPPPTAFFTEPSRQTFAQHPEKFARQRLMDMKAKLPALPSMARRINRDDWVATKKWWQFWRR
jgi:hypothetical protein